MTPTQLAELRAALRDQLYLIKDAQPEAESAAWLDAEVQRICALINGEGER